MYSYRTFIGISFKKASMYCPMKEPIYLYKNVHVLSYEGTRTFIIISFKKSACIVL